MSTIGSYENRPIKFLKKVSYKNWRLKVYGIAAAETDVSNTLIDVAINKVVPLLPKKAITDVRYGVGFLIIHIGTLKNWFLLDWWEHQDILCHKLFASPLDQPDVIEEEKKSDFMACVYELKVISFESEAWIKTVLQEETKSSIEAYMKLILNTPT